MSKVLATTLDRLEDAARTQWSGVVRTVCLEPGQARALLDELERVKAEAASLRGHLASLGENRTRAKEAGRRNTRRAVRALERVPELPKRYRDALEVRASDPDLTLAECGAKLGLTKDSFHARLRRALLFAEERMAEQADAMWAHTSGVNP